MHIDKKSHFKKFIDSFKYFFDMLFYMRKIPYTFLIYLFAYTLLVAIIYFLLNYKEYIQNNFIISLIIAVLLILPSFTIFLRRRRESVKFQEGKARRYTMHCKNCNWEWMSNVSDKAPTQCPNCREKENLEILGWRNVSQPKKKEQGNLTKYISS